MPQFAELLRRASIFFSECGLDVLSKFKKGTLRLAHLYPSREPRNMKRNKSRLPRRQLGCQDGTSEIQRRRSALLDLRSRWHFCKCLLDLSAWALSMISPSCSGPGPMRFHRQSQRATLSAYS